MKSVSLDITILLTVLGPKLMAPVPSGSSEDSLVRFHLKVLHAQGPVCMMEVGSMY